MKLLEQLRREIRVRHYSIRTEHSYVDWVKRFILFHNKKHPKDMGAAEINRFLSHLASDRNVAANATSYSTYVVVFPTVKDSPAANSMQIAEVQLNDAAGAPLFSPNSSIVGGQLIPEPSTIAIAVCGLVGLGIVRYRRK